MQGGALAEACVPGGKKPLDASQAWCKASQRFSMRPVIGMPKTSKDYPYDSEMTIAMVFLSVTETSRQEDLVPTERHSDLKCMKEGTLYTVLPRVVVAWAVGHTSNHSLVGKSYRRQESEEMEAVCPPPTRKTWPGREAADQ